MWWLSLALAAPVIDSVQAPSLRWEALQSDHFEVHYSVDRRTGASERATAERALAEAEAAWLPLCDAVDYFPVERIHLLLLPEDGMEGWAWPGWDWVVLTAHPGGVLERQRGPMDPLRMVLRHELAHVLHLKKAKALAEPIQGLELGVHLWSGDRDGRLDATVELAAAGPFWWSEGSAEALVIDAGLAEVGAERAATLRTSMVEYRWLGEEWRSRFAKEDWGDSERVYQQGRAFVQWLADARGVSIADLAADASRTGSVRRSLVRLTGRPVDELVDAFVATLDVPHTDRIAPGVDLDAVGELPGRAAGAERARERTGTWDLWPTAAPGLFAQHDRGALVVERVDVDALPAFGGDAVAGELLFLPIAYGSRPALAADGSAAVVVADDGLDQAVDLAVLDRTRLFRVPLYTPFDSRPGVIRRRVQALEGTEHAIDPALSADGQTLAFVRVADGGGQLWVGPVEGPYRQVAGGAGHWWRTPAFLADGRLVAVHRVGDGAEIEAVPLDGGAPVPWTRSAADEADLTATSDGRLLFTADLDGVRDVFALDPGDGSIERWTRSFGGAHTPSLTPAGHLLYVEGTAHGFKARGVPAEAIAAEDVTARFAAAPVAVEPVPVPAHVQTSGRGLAPLAMTPFVNLGMGGVGDVDLVAGASASTRSWTDGVDLRAAVWVGEELGASAGLRQWMGPLDLRLAGFHTVWERPTPVEKIEGTRSEGSVAVGLDRGPFRSELAVRAARIGIRDYGAVGLVGGRLRAGVEEVARRDLAFEGYVAELGAETGREGDASYGFGWVHVDAELRAPREIAGAWRMHHAVLLGLDLAVSRRGAHPYLRPRAGGMAREGLLGFTAAFPGYPELSLVGDALVVTRLGYRFPLAHFRRRVGFWFGEGATAELVAHAGQAWDAGSVPGLDLGVTGTPWAGDVGGRLVLRGTVRDARWDLGLRVAVPMTSIPVRDIDGDDVFDIVPTSPDPRDQPPRARFMIEFGRL